MNIVSGPMTVKHQLKHLGDVFRKYRLDKVSALGEINNQSKHGTCYKSTNTVMGLVSANEQQYSLGVVLRQKTGQVSKKLS